MLPRLMKSQIPTLSSLVTRRRNPACKTRPEKDEASIRRSRQALTAKKREVHKREDLKRRRPERERERSTFDQFLMENTDGKED